MITEDLRKLIELLKNVSEEFIHVENFIDDVPELRKHFKCCDEVEKAQKHVYHCVCEIRETIQYLEEEET